MGVGILASLAILCPIVAIGLCPSLLQNAVIAFSSSGQSTPAPTPSPLQTQANLPPDQRTAEAFAHQGGNALERSDRAYQQGPENAFRDPAPRPVPQPRGVTQEEQYQTLRPETASYSTSIVKIISFLPDGRAKQGTGWFLNKETVLTDFHVVEDGIRFAVFYEDGQSSEALFLNGNSACDLAALIVIRPRADQGFLPLIADSNAVLPNTPVLTISYLHGNRTLSTGKLFRAYTTDRVRQYGNYALFKSDLCSTHGGSGGPVLNAQGEVVGMLEALDRAGDVYIISANVIWEALDITGGNVHPGGFRTGATSELLRTTPMLTAMLRSSLRALRARSCGSWSMTTIA
jgi:S1-C subfamily serine protease